MAKTTLLFDNNGLDFIEIDATPQETHSHTLEVTQHPVERGADISDHARPKADMLPLDCAVSDTEAGRSSDIYERLRLLQDKAVLMTVITTLRTYDNMILQSLSTTRTAKDAGGLRFTVIFQQIELVQNKTTVVTVTREPITKPKISNGKQPTKQAADGPQKERSWAKSADNSTGIVNTIGGLFTR